MKFEEKLKKTKKTESYKNLFKKVKDCVFPFVMFKSLIFEFLLITRLINKVVNHLD